MECADDVGFISQFLGSLTQVGFDFKILFEIIFTSLDIELEHIVELLNV